MLHLSAKIALEPAPLITVDAIVTIHKLTVGWKQLLFHSLLTLKAAEYLSLNKANNGNALFWLKFTLLSLLIIIIIIKFKSIF